MERPYIICHILSALDGKITGAFMGTKAVQTVSEEYARIRSEYQADAWLYVICGGGTINWTFLQQGAVDELSLLIAPAADGNPDSVTVFEKSALLPPGSPAVFQLKNIERLKGDGVRLVYTVKEK